MCAPPDFAELLARVGAPLVPVGQPVHPMGTGATPPTAADLPRRATKLVAAQLFLDGITRVLLVEIFEAVPRPQWRDQLLSWCGTPRREWTVTTTT